MSSRITDKVWLGDEADAHTNAHYDVILDVRPFIMTPTEQDNYVDVDMLDVLADLINRCVKKEYNILVHCVPPGTMIGSIIPTPIERIKDNVIGADGETHRIIEKIEHKCDTLLEIKTNGTLPLQCTYDHKLLVFRTYREPSGFIYKPNYKVRHNHIAKWNSNNPVWLDAKDIRVGDFLLSPKFSLPLSNDKAVWLDKKDHFNVKNVMDIICNDDMAWLIGLYVADGSTVGDYAISFTLSMKDDLNRLIRCIESIGIKPHVRRYDNYVRVQVNSRIMANTFRKWFGSSSHEKRLPSFIFSGGWNLSEVIHGLVDGDGSINKKRAGSCQITFSTVSLALAYQVWHILITLGEYPHLSEYRRKSGYPNASKLWSVFWAPGAKQHRTAYWNNYYCLPVTSIKEIVYSGEVFNLEIDEEHTYITNGAISHNCHGGIERAPLVVVWYLVRYDRNIHTLEEAYTMVQRCRPIVQDRACWIPFKVRCDRKV